MKRLITVTVTVLAFSFLAGATAETTEFHIFGIPEFMQFGKYSWSPPDPADVLSKNYAIHKHVLDGQASFFTALESLSQSPQEKFLVFRTHGKGLDETKGTFPWQPYVCSPQAANAHEADIYLASAFLPDNGLDQEGNESERVRLNYTLVVSTSEQSWGERYTPADSNSQVSLIIRTRYEPYAGVGERVLTVMDRNGNRYFDSGDIDLSKSISSEVWGWVDFDKDGQKDDLFFAKKQVSELWSLAIDIDHTGGELVADLQDFQNDGFLDVWDVNQDGYFSESIRFPAGILVGNNEWVTSEVVAKKLDNTVRVIISTECYPGFNSMVDAVEVAASAAGKTSIGGEVFKQILLAGARSGSQDSWYNVLITADALLGSRPGDHNIWVDGQKIRQDYSFGCKFLDDLNFLNPTPGYKLAPIEEVDGLGHRFSLAQNYPNPFNATTTIGYSVAVAGQVELKVYDLLGKEVATLVNEIRPAGQYSVDFDAANLASGIYFYTIFSSQGHLTRKMTHIR